MHRPHQGQLAKKLARRSNFISDPERKPTHFYRGYGPPQDPKSPLLSLANGMRSKDASKCEWVESERYKAPPCHLGHTTCRLRHPESMTTPGIAMQIYITAAALAGLASAAMAPLNPAAVREVGVLGAALAARQDGDNAGPPPDNWEDREKPGCKDRLLSIVFEIPKPSGVVESWATKASWATEFDFITAMPSALPDLCAVPTHAPASLSSDVAAYEAEVLSWYGAYSSSIAAMVQDCTVNPNIIKASSIIDQLTKNPRCTSALALATGASPGGSGTATPTITDAPSGPGGSVTGGGDSAGSTSTPADSGAGTIGLFVSSVAGAAFLCLAAIL